MKIYFLTVLLCIFSLTTFEATAQNKTVEKTKNKAKNKTNNRVDNKIDRKLDEGLDAIEGLFKRKKKKKKNKKEDQDNDNVSTTNSNNNSDQNAQQKDGGSFLDKMLGGEGSVEVKPSYTFNSNFLMRMQTYKQNGKEKSDMLMRYYNSSDPNYMAMEVMEVDKNGKAKSLESKIIVDGSQRAMITLMEDQKQAIAMKMPNFENYEQAQTQEQDPEQAMKDANVKITRTGRTKSILGYTCSETIMETDDMKATSWTTKQVKLSQFKAFAGMMIQNKKDKNQLMAVPMEFTMEMESTDKKTGEKVNMVVTEINENQNTTINMSNYKVMDMSGLMNGGN